jgi:hypothetical protein
MATVTGYDSTTLEAVVGLSPKPFVIFVYANGPFANHTEAELLFPGVLIKLIATNASVVADFLDIEPECATIEESDGWFHMVKEHGVEKPGFYISVSSANELVAYLASKGITRDMYWLWTAHYDPSIGAHICHPGCYADNEQTADQTQWTDKDDGRNVDGDLCQAYVYITPKPADPNHYDWYPDQEWELDGAQVNERKTAIAYDKFRALQLPLQHPDRPDLQVLRDHCSQLAARIDTLAHEQMVGGKPSYELWHRRWRRDRLLERSEGKRVAS